MRRSYSLVGLFALMTLIAVAFALSRAAAASAPISVELQAAGTVLGFLVGTAIGFLTGYGYGFSIRDYFLGAMVGGGFGALAGMLLASGVDGPVMAIGSFVLVVYAISARVAARWLS